jgi:uncharacterized protein (UPF0333 family)
MKKGQGSIEYIMTHSWAVLVIMVIIATLYYLVVFNVQRQTPTTISGMNNLKPILAQTQAGSNQAFTTVIANGIGTQVKIINATITGDGIEKTIFLDNTLGAKETMRLVFDDAYDEGYVDLSPITIHLSIVYDVPVGGVTAQKTDSGTINTQVTGTVQTD